MDNLKKRQKYDPRKAAQAAKNKSSEGDESAKKVSKEDKLAAL